LKNLVVVSYHYPPSTRVGGKRMAFLTEEWQIAGCNVAVVSAPRGKSGSDNSLPSPGNPVRPLPLFDTDGRGFLSRLASRLRLMEKQESWLPRAVFPVISAVNSIEAEAIVATGPPFVSFAVASIAASRCDVPLFLDYRDPWTTLPNSRRGSGFRLAMSKKIESLISSRGSGVVFCSQRLHESFESCQSGRLPGITITNGFHPFDGGSINPRDGVVISYAGNFYGERRLSVLAEPLSSLSSRGILDISTLRIRVFGRVLSSDIEALERHGLSRCIEELPFLSRNKLLEELAASDILFLPSGSDVPYAIPFKFYDYLSVARPILAVCPADSQLRDLMDEGEWGEWADISNCRAIESSLERMISGGIYSFSGTERFLWPELARRYLEFMDHCISRSSRGDRNG